MTFDESNAKITQHLTGRTIEHVERQGKELRICCSCGHEVVLQADVNGDIQFKGQAVKIILPQLALGAHTGM